MTGTAERMRAWTGPALLAYGFRPFFLFAGLWAALAMAVWVAMLTGLAELPTAFDPVSWHAHEMLFGYLGAVAAGFLLTAVPNWTGRLPIVGWPLGGLVALWLLGRIAVATSAHLPPLAVALADLSCLLALIATLAREIVAGRNWRNLIALGMLGVLTVGNALFHWQAAGGHAASGSGLRLGLAAAIMMIMVIGGRIVPSFTRNWLVRRKDPARPAPFGRFDRVALLIGAGALGLWVAAPDALAAGLALLLAGVVHVQRLLRWCGRHTGAEPLVWILHVGYAFVPLGALVMGIAILFPDMLARTAAQHLWTAGAVGVMTLAVMTRATLGHGGHPLSAGAGTTLLYVALIASALARFWAGLAPGAAMTLFAVSGLLWCAAFLGFAAIYGPILLRRRPAG